MTAKVEILADKDTLVDRAKELVIQHLEQAIAERGQASLALSGGSTPKPLYEALAQASLPWHQLQIFFGDERYVPRDHPDSNQRMARQAWLDHVDIPAHQIHAMPTTADDPKVDAQTYENELARVFHLAAGEFPRLDLVLLGLGDDGHTASLFPHTAALQVCDRLVTVGDREGQPRLTLTIPLLNQARCVLFLVAGASKQTALSQIFDPTTDPQAYPARFIQPQGELIWLLDAAAGANLQP
ncbi:6-phosphogluconolactonase [Synechocystis sp. LKSZ1]|uniref:6-phosphogluconolactonase n=1 Tax=Synechocystis sp. LKSZ1 TaxID=3144951 RepID=UPI00336BF028